MFPSTRVWIATLAPLGLALGACQAALDLEGYTFAGTDAGSSPAVFSQEPAPACTVGDPACECTGCWIEGACRGTGDTNDANVCQVCDPARSRDDWSHREAPCDDGLFCTTSDRCESGACRGSALPCDDGVSCNGISACDEDADRCSGFTNLCTGGQSCDSQTDRCVDSCPDCSIAGVCVPAGAEEPGNPCRVCDPARSGSEYSVAENKPCGAGPTECSQQDACDAAGICARRDLAEGTPCGSNLDSACDAPDTCDGSGTCDSRRLPNDTACEDGDFCSSDDRCQGGSCSAGALPRCGPSQLCDEANDQCQNIFVAVGAGRFEAMDAAGTTLVGSATNGQPAVRWTADTGIDALDGAGSLTGDFARGVNADGSVIVGRARGPAFIDTRPFRWTLGTGMVPLAGALLGPDSQHPEGSDIYATGVSDDGNVIVGTGCIPFPSCIAFRWTQAGGFEDLGHSGANFASASAVSADGTVVVGNTGFGTTPAAFRWTRQGLGVLPTELDWHASIAAAVSSDGNTIVGSRRLLDPEGPLLFPERAVRWISSRTPFELPVPESWGFSIALDVSANGNVIVGRGGADDSNPARNAWIWDFRSDEVRLIHDVLTAAGVDLADWQLSEATAVSEDGRVIAGMGVGPTGSSGWIARLP